MIESACVSVRENEWEEICARALDALAIMLSCT